MEEDQINELDELFLNTQAQSNLDMWNDTIAKQKSVNDLRNSLQERFAYRDGDDDSIRDETNNGTSLLKEIDTNSNTQDASNDTKKDIKIRKSKEHVFQSNKKRKRSCSSLKSIGAHVMKQHSKEKTSLLQLLSGKKRKMNDLLSTIDEIEKDKLDETFNAISENPHGLSSDIIYSKDEWFNLLKIIRINFPSLSKGSKLTLSKINKIYERHYDNSMENGIPLTDSVDDETPVLWNMASSFPKTRLTDEDIKWLYDLKDNDSKNNSINSSFIEADDYINDENNILTLSQLIDQHRMPTGTTVDSNTNQVIDLTQNLDDNDYYSNNNSDLEKSNKIYINTHQSVTTTSENPKLDDSKTDVIKQIETPKKLFAQNDSELIIPCSSPRASPILISPKKIEKMKKRLDFVKGSDIQIKGTMSVSETTSKFPSQLESNRPFNFIENDIFRSSVNNNYEIEVIPDSEEDEDIKILIPNATPCSKNLPKQLQSDSLKISARNLISDIQNIQFINEKDYWGARQESGKLSSQDLKDILEPEKEKKISNYENKVLIFDECETEVNQLKNLVLNSVQETQISDTETESCKSVYLSAQTHVQSLTKPTIKARTRYEFKGYLSEIFEAPFGKYIETKITHEKKIVDPEVILDSESEDEGDLSIIEIIKEIPVNNSKEEPNRNFYENSESVANPSDSEIQVFSSQNMENDDSFNFDSIPLSHSAEDFFVDSSVFDAFNEFTVIGIRLLLSKWGFRSRKSKKENAKFLSTIYTIISQSRREYAFEIEFSKEGGNEAKSENTKKREDTINKFYDKLSMIRCQDIQNALFNYISELVEKNENLYSRILRYMPITLTEVQKLLKKQKVDIDKETLRAWADHTSVTYTLEWHAKQS